MDWVVGPFRPLFHPHILEIPGLAQHDIENGKLRAEVTASMGESRFLLINLGVVLLLLILFLRKSKVAPTRFNLSPKKLPTKSNLKTAERNLNCMFQYNGHTWDAHELLGVPAGAPAEAIKAGYDQAIKNSVDQQSKAILEAALSALKERGQV
jgi:hypothetical protein